MPGIASELATASCRVGETDVERPQLGPTELRVAIEHAIERAVHDIRPMPVDDVLDRLDRVIVNWLNPGYHLRRLAGDVLPAATGFSSEMIRHGLPRLLEPLRAQPLRALLEAELGETGVLDGFRRGRRVIGPRLITHVLSGNIPGLAATPMALSLALKSAAFIKSAAGDPLFPALFAASVMEVDERLGHGLAVAYWRGGERALETVAFRSADVVVASGSDAAVAAIRARVDGRFIGYGHKVSFAVIARECLVDAQAASGLARRLAYDVTLWDQQGCLSPQLCYLESRAGVSPEQFADFLAVALDDYARELPPRTLELEEKTQMARFRHDAEWRPETLALLSSPGSTAWTVSLERGAAFLPTCLNRCIRLKLVEDLTELPAALIPYRYHLEAAGIAASPERRADLVEQLAASGVHRICPIGTMQEPTLAWQQGGRPRVADWVEWAQIEDDS